jgi:hypothetical protein
MYNTFTDDIGEPLCSPDRFGFDEGFVREGHGRQMVAGPSATLRARARQ